jgi:rhodanese-related sulfurtransferase
MGFPNVYVLEGGADAVPELERGFATNPPAGYEASRVQTAYVTPADLQARLNGSEALRTVFTGTSEEYIDGHVPGSRWLPRGWLELWADELVPGKDGPVVVTDADGAGATLAAAQLRAIGYGDVSVLEGGMQAWRKAGLAVETGLSNVMRAPDDVLPVRRSYAEMLNYLRWEEALGEKYRVH